MFSLLVLITTGQFFWIFKEEKPSALSIQAKTKRKLRKILKVLKNSNSIVYFFERDKEGTIYSRHFKLSNPPRGIKLYIVQGV